MHSASRTRWNLVLESAFHASGSPSRRTPIDVAGTGWNWRAPAAGTPREDFGTDDGMMMDGEAPFNLDEGEDADAMVDYLVIVGADRTEAKHKVNE